MSTLATAPSLIAAVEGRWPNPLGVRPVAIPPKHHATVDLLEAEFAVEGAGIGFHRLRFNEHERLFIKLAERFTD